MYLKVQKWTFLPMFGANIWANILIQDSKSADLGSRTPVSWDYKSQHTSWSIRFPRIGPVQIVAWHHLPYPVVPAVPRWVIWLYGFGDFEIFRLSRGELRTWSIVYNGLLYWVGKNNIECNQLASWYEDWLNCFKVNCRYLISKQNIRMIYTICLIWCTMILWYYSIMYYVIR